MNENNKSFGDPAYLDLVTTNVYILGAHKSGTTLLRSLFDGSPKTFSIPFETHFFELTGQWVYYPLRSKEPEKLTLEEMKERLSQYIQTVNQMDSSENMGGQANMNLVDRFDLARFRQTLEDRGTSYDQLLIAYFQAILNSVTNYQDKDNVEFIFEKSVENSEFVPLIKALDPNCKFVHIVRNPYSNLVSLRRYAMKRLGKYPRIDNYARGLHYSYYTLYRNMTIEQDTYLIIRYEDLLSEPDKTVKQICKFLGLPFDKAFLTPSVFGELWVGNSSLETKHQGISATNLHAWRKEITRMEIDLINKYCSQVIEDFGYERLSKESGKKRNPREGYKEYLLNRLAKYYR